MHMNKMTEKSFFVLKNIFLFFYAESKQMEITYVL